MGYPLQSEHFQPYPVSQGRIQDFKLLGGWAHLKKLRQAEGGAKLFWVFRVKNHDFTPINHIFSYLGAPPRPWIHTYLISVTFKALLKFDTRQ